MLPSTVPALGASKSAWHPQNTVQQRSWEWLKNAYCYPLGTVIIDHSHMSYIIMRRRKGKIIIYANNQLIAQYTNISSSVNIMFIDAQ